MAGELQASWTGGRTVYFLLRNASAQIWNGTTFEGYVTADYASYKIAATEQGTASGYYVADMPAGIPFGTLYSVVAREQAGGAPLETDQEVGQGTIPWPISSVQTGDVFAFLTTALAESYAAKGAAPTLTQLLFELLANVCQPSVSDTTFTARRIDGVTPATTYTLDDPIKPTTKTRAT